MWRELKRMWRHELFQTMIGLVLLPVVVLYLVMAALTELVRLPCEWAMDAGLSADEWRSARRRARRSAQQDG